MLAPHRLIMNLKSVGTPEAFFLHVEGICLTSAITTRLSEQISSRTANISHHPLGEGAVGLLHWVEVFIRKSS